MASKKLIAYVSSRLTNNELLRVFDLTLSNGRSSYTKEEHKILDKIRDIKHEFGASGN